MKYCAQRTKQTGSLRELRGSAPERGCSDKLSRKKVAFAIAGSG